jgi:DNA replication protein DnaC
MNTINPIIKQFIGHVDEMKKPSGPQFQPADIKAAWMKVAEFLKPGYEFDTVANEMFPRLFAPEVKKGVCFSGSKGIGKTLNLDIFSKINHALYKVETEVWEVTEIEIQYKAGGAGLLDKLGRVPALVINEIGMESKSLMDFGTARNLIADLLILRYRAFQTHGYKTYLTSNMKWDSIRTHYGERIADRMQEMFIPMLLTGESKRK